MKIMCEMDFETHFHYRESEKCCAGCKYCIPDFKDVAICFHPARNDNGVDTEYCGRYRRYNVSCSCICDGWESREKKGETK